VPLLVKGGKWVFGWVMVEQDAIIRIPPEAYVEYGFQAGEAVFITRGSQTSGGLGVGRWECLSHAQVSMQSRLIGQSRINSERQVVLPPNSSVMPGERLLAVRGSGLALGFIQRGLINEEALKHAEIEIF